MPTLKEDLAAVLNSHSVENDSDTPDFVLAAYLTACLSAYATAIRDRDHWFETKATTQAGEDKISECCQI